ncbi:MAG: hypothetical protein ACLTFZ_11625 [Lachnospiraceae bacterium]
MNNGAIYLGTEQFITLVTVLSICGAVLVFLVKHSFNQINNGIAGNSTKIESIKNDLQQDIQKNHDKVNERINKLEDKTNADITEIRQNLNDIKGDFATTFVLREDFFRYMNSMEENIKDTNSKVDKILLIVTDGDRRKNNGTE